MHDYYVAVSFVFKPECAPSSNELHWALLSRLIGLKLYCLLLKKSSSHNLNAAISHLKRAKKEWCPMNSLNKKGFNMHKFGHFKFGSRHKVLVHYSGTNNIFWKCYYRPLCLFFSFPLNRQRGHFEITNLEKRARIRNKKGRNVAGSLGSFIQDSN